MWVLFMKISSFLSALLLVALFFLLNCTPSSAAESNILSRVEYESRSQRITAFFKERQARYGVASTTKTKSGQVIDWIKLESQLPDGQEIAQPPVKNDLKLSERQETNEYLQMELPESLRKLARQELKAKTEFQTDPSTIGPPGTVPVVRFDLKAYLKAHPTFLPSDPREVISKIPPPAPASNNRYYAVWQRFADNYGTLGRINIWNVDGPVGGETSIAQTAVIRGTPMQAIEAGKIETAGFSPSKRPTFFTYFRTNGSASGDFVGGYNALVDGWIQVSRSVAPGMSLVPWESTLNGSQYSLDVEVRLWQGNWWVRAAGEWAGYYPSCKGGGSAPCANGTLFSEDGIRDKADRLDWYAEVFDESAPSSTSTDMGSGQFSNQRWGRAAYFRNLLYMWSTTNAWWWSQGSITTTDNRCYDADGPYYSSDDNWRNWFYYGGPGKEAKGCI
jgi:Neprosin